MLQVTLVLLLLSFSAQSAVKEIFLPTLECQGHLFDDVTISYDESRTKREDLTISLVCEKLTHKLVKRPVVNNLSRFLLGSSSPKEIEQYGKRADAFFKILLFKPNIIRRIDFTFTEHKLREVMETLKQPRHMQLRQFHPSADNMHVLAYQQGGAAYLNAFKLERKPCSVINTLVHEYMHFLGYGHGDNHPTGKEHSVPFHFGTRAQELCEAGVI